MALVQKITGNHGERRKFLRRLADDKRFLGIVFLAPAILYIVALVAIPLLMAIRYSLTEITMTGTGITTYKFVGLENFREIMNFDAYPQMQRALRNSLLFSLVAQVFVTIGANILALVLAEDFRGKWLARMLIMLPWATPISLGVIAWLWLLDSKFAPIDWVLLQLLDAKFFAPIDWVLLRLGLPGVHEILFGDGSNIIWLGKESLAVMSDILVYVWRMLPLSAVILLAGLTSIDQELLDQADVDGASFWRKHFRIRMPLVMPIMSIAVLFSFIFTIGDMAVVYLLTKTGPVYYTHVLPTWAYMVGIEGNAISQGAAITLFLFPVLAAVAFLVLRTARRMEVT